MRHNSGHYCWWPGGSAHHHRHAHAHGVAASIQQGHVEIGGSLLDPVITNCDIDGRAMVSKMANTAITTTTYQGKATQAAHPGHGNTEILDHTHAALHK
jgi:hypothetical protein